MTNMNHTDYHRLQTCILAFSLFLFFFVIFCRVPQASPATIMSIYPLSTTVTIEDTVYVNVTITDVIDIAGWQAEIFYSNNVLTAQSIVEGPFLQQGGSTSWFVLGFNNNYNSTHGWIWAACVLLGNVSGVDGSGVLAKLVFSPFNSGVTPIHLAGTRIGDSDANPIDHTTVDGSVQVEGLADIAIIDVTPSTPYIGQGQSMTVDVVVANQGPDTETFNVSVYANTTLINTVSNVILASETSDVLTITWNTNGFNGNYTISANATHLPGETDLADNTYSDGIVTVRWPYDVNGDGYVGIDDIVLVAEHFGETPASPGWDPKCDINPDSYIGIDDIVAVAEHFGETPP